MSDFLRSYGLQHTRLPRPSLSPRVCSNSCPLSRWGHLGPLVSSVLSLIIPRTILCSKALFCQGNFVINCYCSVAKLCLTLCDPMDCSTPGFPVLHCLLEFVELMSIEAVMPSNHLILCRPLLLLPLILTSVRVFSNESALCIKWPKYWSFSFSISPSNEYSG